MQKEFLGYLNDWEIDVQTRPGKFDSEARKKMLLSTETFSGLRQSSKYLKLNKLLVVFLKVSKHVLAKAMIGIISFLLKKGAKYVLTANFSQDPLEIEFSRHRQACGSSQNPTVYTFGNNCEPLYLLKKKNLNLHSARGNTSVATT